MSARNYTLRNQFLTAALIVCTLASFFDSLATPARAMLVTINESFTGTTATDWSLLNSASLTAATGIDAAGSGWLRLTDAVNNQAGSAINNIPFSSSDGVQITFQYATYGGTGADGFSFYLIDGATPNPTVGGSGGGLGYSSGSGGDNGVTSGYVGIGFDEWGNFTTDGVGICNPSCPGLLSDTVAIRGSGTLATGFNLLTYQQLSPSRAIGTGSRSTANTVRITILDQVIKVEMDFGSGFVTIINGCNLATAVGQATIPATFKMGFSASTGGSTNTHEIRGLTVGGAQPTATVLAATPKQVQEGQPVTLTATVSNSLGDPRVPSGTVTFLANGVSIGIGTLNAATGVVTFTTSALVLGTHSITARYEGDAVFGTSTSSVVSQIVIPFVTLTTTTTPSYSPNGSAEVIQPTIIVTGNGTLDGALVLISANFVPISDTLGIQGKTGTSGTVDGLTWIYTPTTGVLALSGNAALSTYQSALRQVTFSSSSSSTLARTIQFSLGSSLPNAANDHYYEFVSGNGITWTAAQVAAAARNFFGLQGYLATVTSAAENAFVASKLQGQGWMGANDVATEGAWFWVTGPETGTQFSTGDNTPTAFANRYMNWNTGEPNNSGGIENYGHFLTSGKWNDYANNSASIQGYVVEYGGMTGDPTIHVRADATVLVDPAGDPDNDGVPTGIEERYGSDPLDMNNPSANPTADDDGDGVTNAWEAIIQTDPADPDSNSARTPATDENNNGISDAAEDLDGDGVPNGIEIRYGTDPLLATSPVISPTADDDGDGVTNAWESILGTNPTVADSNSTKTTPNEAGNGINDGAEDFDGDGVTNAQEITNGTNPLDPNDPLKTDLEVTQAFQMANLSKLTLTITVTNKGPNAVASAVLSDTFPPALTGGVWSWGCSGTACSAASGTGNLNAILGTLPVSGTVVFTATGTLANWTHWTNTARIILSAKTLDSVIGNNTSQIGRYRLLLPIVYKR